LKGIQNRPGMIPAAVAGYLALTGFRLKSFVKNRKKGLMGL